MKSLQIKYENSGDFVHRLEQLKNDCAGLPSGKMTFYISWTDVTRNLVVPVTDLIEKYFPDSVFYGNEASGNILNGDLSYGVTVTCNLFEDPDTRLELIWVEEGTEYSSLQNLWDYCRKKAGLKAVELIPSISYLDALKMDGSIPELSEDVLIFGGASVNYDNPTFDADILAKGHPITRDGLAALLYYGEKLSVSSTYVLGWKGLGKQMRVTKSQGKVISRIDDRPPFSIYEKYLNLKEEDNDNLIFPLIVEEDGVEYIRTPQTFLPDKSVRMFVNIAEGTLTRIAYGDKNTILRSLYEKSPEIEAFCPQAIKAYSCAARRLFWGDTEVGRETLPLQSIAPVCGFYTGGEILRFGAKLRVLNSTLVLISLREGAAEKQVPANSLRYEETDKSLLSRITYFAEAIVREQEQQQIELSRRTALINYFMKSYALAYYCNLSEGTVLVLQGRDGFPTDENGRSVFTQEKIDYSVEKHVHPEDQERVRSFFRPEHIRSQLKDSDDYSFMFRGKKWNLTYRCTVIRGDDEDHVAIGFMNITDELRQQQEHQKQLQDALEMADSANRAKTEFLFNMSHDIRTPMNAITGFTSMAIKHIDDREKALDCLIKTQQSGHLLLSLINSVLEVSRIESGHAVLEEKPGDVFYSFVNVETTLNEMAASKGVSLNFEFGQIRNRYVFCDINRCNRIFVNIITNGIKYTPEGGFVRVRCEQIGDALDGFGYYRYTIEDNGIGMSEEFQKHVFEQFSREKSVTLSGIQGTGLGMAVVKSFVDLMNGTIDCQSEVGKGTVFTVVLPFRLQDGTDYTDPFTDTILSAAYDLRPYEASAFCGKRVLLVEDNEMNREIAIDILEEEGLAVEDAEDGSVAVKLLELHGPEYYDYILMDIQMPVMNGYEATKAIREMYPDIHIPIIALSANAFAEDRAASLKAGMDDHVAKPIEIEKLFSALARFL